MFMFWFQAQRQYEAASSGQITYPSQGTTPYPAQGATPYPQQPPAYPTQGAGGLYPSLGDYMGLSLTPEFVEQNMPVVAHVNIIFSYVFAQIMLALTEATLVFVLP